MPVASLLAAVMVAFPRQGQELPAVDSCYMIGSAPPGTLNVWVQGESVKVHDLGGWVTMVKVTEGTNCIQVAGTNVSFVVAKKPSAALISDGTNQSEKVYRKLDYAADSPIPHPTAVTDKPGDITIVLDPGHGGAKDRGATSPHNLPESDANLRMAKAVRKELVKRGFKVLMTRESDVAIPLYDRPRLAHKSKAAAFVSIHHNAPPFDRDPRKVRTTDVYAWNDIGANLAKCINDEMAEVLGKENIANGGVRHANFAVTRNPEIPSCLVEVDFITTPEGEIDCWNPDRRSRIAVSIASGIATWALGKQTN